MFDTIPGFLTFVAFLCGALAAFCLRSRSWKISCGAGLAVFVLLFLICRGMGGLLAPAIMLFFTWPVLAICFAIAAVQIARTEVKRRRATSLRRNSA